MPVNARVALRENCRDARLCNNLAWTHGQPKRFTSRRGGVWLSSWPRSRWRLSLLAPATGTRWDVAQYRAGDWKSAGTAIGESMRRQDGGNAHDWIFMAMICSSAE